MKNTEQTLLLAMISALMGRPVNPSYRATGVYSNRSRRIELDFRVDDIGPVIGRNGAMKLAIQTILAAPMGGDAVQIIMHSTRENKSVVAPPGPPRAEVFEPLMAALKDHYPVGHFDYKVELSPSAVVVICTGNPLLIDEVRGALSRVVRAVGKHNGFIAAISAEKNG